MPRDVNVAGGEKLGLPDALPAEVWAAIEQAVLRDINRRGPIARAVEDLVRSRLPAPGQPPRRA